MSGSYEWEMLLEWLNASPSSPLSPAPGKTLLVDGLPTALHLLRNVDGATGDSKKHGKNYPKLWVSAVVDLFKKQQGSHRVVALVLIQKTLEIWKDHEASGLQKFIDVIGLALKKESPSELRLQAVAAFAAWLHVAAEKKASKSQIMSRSSDALSRCFSALGQILMEESWYRNDLLHLLRMTARMVHAAPSSCRGVVGKMETFAARHVLSGDKALRSTAARLLGKLPLCFGGQGGRAWENLLVVLMNSSVLLLRSGIGIGLGKSNGVKRLDELELDGEVAAWSGVAGSVRSAVEQMEGDVEGSQWKVFCAVVGVADALSATLTSGETGKGDGRSGQRRTFVRLPQAQLLGICEANLRDLLSASSPGLAQIDAVKAFIELLSAVVDVAGLRSMVHTGRIQGLLEDVSRAIRPAEGEWKRVQGAFFHGCTNVLRVLGPGFVRPLNVPIEFSVGVVETAAARDVSRTRKRKKVGSGRIDTPAIDTESLSEGLELLTTALSLGGGLLSVPLRLRIEQALLRLQANKDLLHGVNGVRQQVRAKALKALSAAMAVPLKGTMVSSRICDAMLTFQRGKASKEETDICSHGEVLCSSFLHPPRKSLVSSKLIERTTQQVLDMQTADLMEADDFGAEDIDLPTPVESKTNNEATSTPNLATPAASTFAPSVPATVSKLPEVESPAKPSSVSNDPTMEKPEGTFTASDEANSKETVAVKARHDNEEPRVEVGQKQQDHGGEDEESDSDESIPSIVT